MKKILFIVMLCFAFVGCGHKTIISDAIKSQLTNPTSFTMYSLDLKSKNGHVREYKVNYGYTDQLGISHREIIEVTMFGDKIFEIDGKLYDTYMQKLETEQILKKLYQ